MLTEPLRWLWPGRIPLGKLTVIIGDSASSKSLLALDIAAQVTRGGDWPDIPRPAPSATNAASPEKQPGCSAAAGLQATAPSVDSTEPIDIEATVDMLEAMMQPQPPPVTLHETQPAHDTPKQPGCSPAAGLLTSPLPPAKPLLAAVPPPNKVLLLNADDHPGHSVRPRLAAARANFDGIIGIKGLYSKDRHFRAPPHGIDLLKHLPLLRTQIQETQNVKLMVIDPLLAYWGKIGPYPSKTTHRVADALSELAAEFNMSILVITDYRHAGLPCRTTYTVRRNWQDEEQRQLIPTQFHYGSTPPDLTYRVHANHITWDSAPIGQSHKPLPTKPTDIFEWLARYLHDGPHEATEIYTAGEAAGFSADKVRRAKEGLGLMVKKKKGVDHGNWTWQLPNFGNSAHDNDPA